MYVCVCVQRVEDIFFNVDMCQYIKKIIFLEIRSLDFLCRIHTLLLSSISVLNTHITQETQENVDAMVEETLNIIARFIMVS